MEIISDRATYFCNTQFEKIMKKYGVNNHLATSYHPQMSGQVEVMNMELKRILEINMHHNSCDQSERLDDALWPYRTGFKTSIGHTSYLMVYGRACNLLVDLEHQAYQVTKFLNFDIAEVGRKLKFQLNELKEDH